MPPAQLYDPRQAQINASTPRKTGSASSSNSTTRYVAVDGFVSTAGNKELGSRYGNTAGGVNMTSGVVPPPPGSVAFGSTPPVMAPPTECGQSSTGQDSTSLTTVTL